jgi:hypothetical protein
MMACHAAMGMDKKNLRDRTEESSFNNKKQKPCIFATTNEYAIQQVIAEKKIDLIEELILTHNVPFDVEDINQHDILELAIYQRKFAFAAKLIIPGICFFSESYFGLFSRKNSIFYWLFSCEIPLPQKESCNLVQHILKNGYIEQERSTSICAISEAFICLYHKKFQPSMMDETQWVDFVSSSIIALLEAGSFLKQPHDESPLHEKVVLKYFKSNMVKKAYERLLYAKNLYDSKIDPAKCYAQLETCFQDNASIPIDFPFRIALSNQYIEILWMIDAIAQAQKYNHHELEKIFTKPDFPHYCTDECKKFLPTFNFVRKLSCLKNNPQNSDMHFAFK